MASAEYDFLKFNRALMERGVHVEQSDGKGTP